MGLKIWGRNIGDRVGYFFHGAKSRTARHNLTEITIFKPHDDKDWSPSIFAPMERAAGDGMPFPEMQAEITGLTLRATFEALCQFEPFRACIIPEKLEFIDEAWARHSEAVNTLRERAKAYEASR